MCVRARACPACVRARLNRLPVLSVGFRLPQSWKNCCGGATFPSAIPGGSRSLLSPVGSQSRGVTHDSLSWERETRAPQAKRGRLLPRRAPAGPETPAPRGRGREEPSDASALREGAACRPAAWASLCPRTSASTCLVPAAWASLQLPHVKGPWHSPATPVTVRAHAACLHGHPSPACHTTGRVTTRTEAFHDGLGASRGQSRALTAARDLPPTRPAPRSLFSQRRGSLRSAMGGESGPHSSPILRTTNKRQFELSFKELNER